MTKRALWTQFILTSSIYIFSIILPFTLGLFSESAILGNTLISSFSLYSGFLSTVSLLLLVNFYLSTSLPNSGGISGRLVSYISLIPFFGILFIIPIDELIATSKTLGLPQKVCYPASFDGLYQYVLIGIYSIFTFVPGSIAFLVTSITVYVFASLWSKVSCNFPIGNIKKGRIE